MATLIPTIFSELYTVALFFSSLLLLKLRVLLRSSISAPDTPAAAARSQYHTLVGTIEAKYPAIPYSPQAENPKSAAAECAVCLSDFCKGEIVRKLDCKHFFHRECLDRWLTSPAAGNYGSSSCPLCRARLALPALEEEVAELAVDEDCGGGEWGRREMFALLAKFREEGRPRR